MSDRRDFLKLVGLGTAALTLPKFDLFANDRRNNYMAKIGIQLYTIRKEIEKDFDTSVKKIADMGYYGFETYPLPKSVTLEHAAKKFNEFGVEVFGMHYDLPVTKEEKEMALRMADAYKCSVLVYHGWPKDEAIKNLDPIENIVNWPKVEAYATLEAIKKTVELYNEAYEFLKTNGLTLCYHNHWWELEETDYGVIPLYYLVENLHPEIFFELDVYWASVAGHNPAEVINDLGDRIKFLHIKDGPAVKGTTTYNHMPAGSGTIDFNDITETGGKNIKWMIVEFDEFKGDIFYGVQQSYNYLTNNKLAEGKK